MTKDRKFMCDFLKTYITVVYIIYKKFSLNNT